MAGGSLGWSETRSALANAKREAGKNLRFRRQPLGVAQGLIARKGTADMKTFLIPVDFSSVTEAVIDTAVTFSRAFDGKVTLLHVVQPPTVSATEYVLPVDIVREATDVGEKVAKAKLDTYTKLFRDAGIEHMSKTKVGPPGPVILDTAKEINADFIIMGSHGHGKLFDFLVGSTASSVIKRAQCGVIIIPPPEKHKHV
jgi:nucleotide-binding universal stress UspA family protein